MNETVRRKNKQTCGPGGPGGPIEPVKPMGPGGPAKSANYYCKKR
jgi:hypothetical protein